MKALVKNDTLKLMVAILLATLVSSCKQDYFDQGEYEKIVSGVYPVEKVDPSQTWNSITGGVIITDMNVDADVKELQVLSSDPSLPGSCYVINSVPASKGVHTDLVYEVDINATEVYAACLCKDGSYIVKKVLVGSQNVDFSNGTTTIPRPSSPISQYDYNFCFDNSFPIPGDFDFNDLVLRVNTKRESATAVRLDVTIAAVGATIMQAAGMRLEGMYPDDIDSVVWVKPFARRDNNENTDMMPMPGENGYIKARNGQVTIPLFSDAHMSMTDGKYIMENEQVEHIFYNTKKTIETNELTGLADGRDIYSPATATIIVYCKDKFTADNITMRRLDAFLVDYYNGALWEIHTCPYKTEQVVHQFISQEGNYSDNKIWAILVPGPFRYPLEGVCLGAYYSNVLAGAYQTYGHAFGQWASDRNSARDWFKYPRLNGVY